MPTETAPSRTFGRRLALITAGGVAARAVAAGWYDAHTTVSGDAAWYMSTARFVSDGVGFVEPLNFDVFHVRVESAAHPPAYSVYLSVMDLVGMHSAVAHRLWSILPAIGAIMLLGLVTRALAGDRAGLIAAAVAAGSLSLIVQSVDLWSEGLYAFMVAVVLWCCLRLTRGPTVGRVVALGRDRVSHADPSGSDPLRVGPRDSRISPANDRESSGCGGSVSV